MTNAWKAREGGLITLVGKGGKQKTYCGVCFATIRHAWEVQDHACCQPLPESAYLLRRLAMGVEILDVEGLEIDRSGVRGSEAKGMEVKAMEVKGGGEVIELDGVKFDDWRTGKRGAVVEDKAVWPTGGDLWGRPQGQGEAIREELVETDARLAALRREHAALADQLDRGEHQEEIRAVFSRILEQPRRAEQAELQALRARMAALHGVRF
jgi:hypothetical protein